MKHMQRSAGQLFLFLLSLAGAGIAIYLTGVHYAHTPLICSASGVIDCARVLSSPYSVIPGTSVPITIPGLGWCIVSAVLAIVGWRLVVKPRWLVVTQFLWTLVGILSVLYLVYVELVRLHSICAWCTGLHAIILLMFLITLAQLPRSEQEVEPEPTREKPTVISGRDKW